MSAQHRTAENFTSAMRSAVEQRGRDWTYPSSYMDEPEWFRDDGQCRYRFRTGEPACLIGQALDNLGLLEQVDREETKSASELLDALGFPQDVQAAADDAQSAQDMGLAWGLALDVYLEALEQREAAAA